MCFHLRVTVAAEHLLLSPLEQPSCGADLGRITNIMSHSFFLLYTYGDVSVEMARGRSLRSFPDEISRTLSYYAGDMKGRGFEIQTQL